MDGVSDHPLSDRSPGIRAVPRLEAAADPPREGSQSVPLSPQSPAAVAAEETQPQTTKLPTGQDAGEDRDLPAEGTSWGRVASAVWGAHVSLPVLRVGNTLPTSQGACPCCSCQSPPGRRGCSRDDENPRQSPRDTPGQEEARKRKSRGNAAGLPRGGLLTGDAQSRGLKASVLLTGAPPARRHSRAPQQKR